MRNLRCPSRDQARQHLSSALKVDEANADVGRIMALYDIYDAAGGAPSEPLKGGGLNARLRATIHASYKLTQRGSLKAIRGDLLEGAGLCPICSISWAIELDHHLPKATFNPLAIYVRNLIPLCHECNQSKGATVPATPAERFVHNYLEAIPDVQFLRATVSIESGGLLAEFDIDPTADLPDLLRQRLEHQLQRLHLNERYAREINNYLVGYATALRSCFRDGGPDAVRTLLGTQAQVEFNQFHRNHWRPVLLRALANHQQFCSGALMDLLPDAQAAGFPMAP